jgi:acyl-[acyl carrier protein]--UDP-N-acetylglucosamine O-acyltransferase
LGLPRPEALAQLETRYEKTKEIIEFVDFIKHSERGICSGAKNDDEEA